MNIKSFTVDMKAVNDSGEFEAILSMPTLDRDMEVIDARAFEPLPDYIPIDIDHGMSVTSTVGSGTPYYEGDVLKFKGSFASTPLGQEVRTLVVEGHVRKMSVAYMGSQYEPDENDGFLHLRKAELLNAAIVAIPSNRQADILAAKSVELTEAKQSKAATLQQVHDLCVSAGAECKAAPAADTKTPAQPANTTEQTPKNPAEDPAPVAGSDAASLPADAQVTRHRAAAAARAALALT